VLEQLLQRRQAAGLDLVSEADESQIFLTTDSRDVLQGLLTAREPPLTVIRLTRQDSISPVRDLSPSSFGSFGPTRSFASRRSSTD